MLLLGKLRLDVFVQENEDARAPIGAWRMEAEEAQWTGPVEVRASFVDAVIEGGQILFTMNRIYKLKVKAEYRGGVLLVERVWKQVGQTSARARARSKA
ncbi:type II toxin-antitoxin system HigB family toxin [Hydrogenophaga sp.]|uniref:type II toxin-antitoxin system HigB family toxin n=1 Tax=Hydrogenophaga sp. TaxID=1904254 RepID=UPI0025C4CB83|nr:type II toxin-antitoxin system HigB family toxin [Hydrogenophaga sp.]MBT9465545.1 type II toxin-antitoxin system HigB family toxin [Hydrogenophaga sp.]